MASTPVVPIESPATQMAPDSSMRTITSTSAAVWQERWSVCSAFAAAPTAWRVRFLVRIRGLTFGLGVVFNVFNLALHLTKDRGEHTDLFVACVIAKKLACAVGAWFSFQSLGSATASENMSWICGLILMMGEMIATNDLGGEVHPTSLVRSYTVICYASVMFGWSPFRHALMVLCTFCMEVLAIHLFVPPFESLADVLMLDFVSGLLAITIGVVMNVLLLQLYRTQVKLQQEAASVGLLLEMACDFVVPLRYSSSGMIVFAEANRELDSFVGARIRAGDALDKILLAETARALEDRLGGMGPLQPLSQGVHLIHFSGTMLPVQLVIVRRDDFLSGEPGREDELETKFLVGLRVIEEQPGGARLDEGCRQCSDGVPSPIVKAVGSARQLSESGFTTKTGMIFGAGGCLEAWRKIAQLGRSEHWLVGSDLLSLHPSRLLGSGGFGLVCEGSYCGAKVAVKFPRKVFSTADGQEGATAVSMLTDYVQELRLLRITKHPNIVIFYGAFVCPDYGELALVLEKMEGPTLDCFILSGDVGDEQKAPILLDMGNAVQYLHSLRPGIVHGDLKPGNVFVEVREGAIITKLADFGLARRMTVSAQNMGGTLRWAAPELVFGSKAASMAADMYSLGQMMYFVLTGRRPYQGYAATQIHAAMKRGTDPTEQWPSGHLAKMLKPVVDHCRVVDPKERIAAVDLADILEIAAQTPGVRKKSIRQEAEGKQGGDWSPKSLPGAMSEDDDILGGGLDDLDNDAVLCQAFRRARKELLRTAQPLS
mmetsp:Transcript_40224/g.93125  ORF Transcript_40224/g.93125 Transcript_40224/m.93125 type:complete len:770 (-) Transcript_40224:17-2326(-)